PCGRSASGARTPFGGTVGKVEPPPRAGRHTVARLRSDGRLEDGPLDAEPPELAVDLDGAAVARAVPARHRRLPRELRVGREPPQRLEHRLRAAGQDVATVCCKVGEALG